jgi:Nidogen-like/Carboxypeptidase regulatory-like domain/IPT/TIG domain
MTSAQRQPSGTTASFKIRRGNRHLGRWLHAGMAFVLVMAALTVTLAAIASSTAEAASNAMVSGFDANTLPPNDDGSTGLINLPFSIDFFGDTFDSLYVNNNGNLTFDSPLSTYTPSGLNDFGSPIIAPFWADVDTAVGDNAVTYGNGTVDGHMAFGVNWPGVDCFVTQGGGLNYFQVLLIDRSDIAAGDFDIEYNYNAISWDSGQASGGDGTCRGGTSAAVGYSNGSSNSLELAGSFDDGAFIDGGADALSSGSQNSGTPGRYIFPIRASDGGGSVSGTVTDTSDNPVSGALVSACGTGSDASTCFVGTTGTDGSYGLLGVADGTYTATVSPPSGSSLNEQTSDPFTVTSPNDTTENFTLTGPTPPPNGTVVTGVGESDIGGTEVPVINWGETSPISTQACSGGTVTATITGVNDDTGMSETTSPVTLTEDPDDPGTFNGELPAVYPIHGDGTVTITITNCPMSSQDGSVDFDIYIDPSGTVVDSAHSDAPIPGATVTLLNSDSLTGTFTPVPNGSAVMSPGNRMNPSTTSSVGQFGWDVSPGYYEVQASKAGCGTVTTPAFQVPPPVENLELTLDCAPAPSITKFSPASGRVGTKVTITGKNLGGVTTVKFNGGAVATVSKDTATKIVVKVPKGAKSGKISVVTRSGSAKSASPFKVT